MAKRKTTFMRLHLNERGEAADLLVKAVLLCIVWYAGIGIYDWIQDVKHERMEDFQNTKTPPIKRPAGF